MKNILGIAGLVAFPFIVQAGRPSAIDYVNPGSVIEFASAPDQKDLALPELRDEQIDRARMAMGDDHLGSSPALTECSFFERLHLTPGSELFLYEMNGGERGALRGAYRVPGHCKDPVQSSGKSRC